MQTRLEARSASHLLFVLATLASATGCPGGSTEDSEEAGPADSTAVTGPGNSVPPPSGNATGGSATRSTSRAATTTAAPNGGSAATGLATSGGFANTATGIGNTGGVAASTASSPSSGNGGASDTVRRTDSTKPGTPSNGGAAMHSRTSATGGRSGNATTTGGSSNNDHPPTGGKTGSSTAVGGSSGNGASSGGTHGGGTANLSDLLVPESGALLGLYYGDASIAATATKLGTNVALHLTYYAWTDDWTRAGTSEDLRAGRIPFVNWELFGAVLDDIIAGKDDAMIKQRAVAAKNLGQKLFVDFGAEMNGDWSPWSGPQNGKSADKYIAAYRHVHDLFVQNGATNVIWAFCPNVTSEPLESWNEPLDYYPGDTYVDWMCVDGYNWGKSESWGEWQSFQEVFAEIYPALASKNKPILIGEMASTELGGSKAEWISQIIPTLRTDFPLIKGLIWFDIDKETDWRISSSTASEAAFKAMANDPWFRR